MESREDLVPSAGLEFLVEEARLAPLTIIATGPATDAASLLLAAPETLDNVRIVWLGGFGDGVNYGNWANRMGELNGRADVQAWRALFEGTVDLLHIPTCPAPAKILVDTATFAGELRELGRPVASYLAEILELWSFEYETTETRKELWDLACVAAVADPDSVTADSRALPTLDAAGAHDFTQKGRVANVVSDLDERRILANLMESLRTHPIA
jgi:inosine-uridine nucleoside N-ribohydrolase